MPRASGVVHQLGTKLNDVAANASEADRTAIVDVTRFFKVGGILSLTHSAATKLVGKIYLSPDEGTTWGQVHSGNIVTGVNDLSGYSVSKDVSGNDSFWWSLEVEEANRLKFIASATGGGASDLLKLIMSAGGVR